MSNDFSGMSLEQLKVMEQKGEPIYNKVLNTTGFSTANQKLTETFDQQIAQISKQMAENAIDPAVGQQRLDALKAGKTQLQSKLQKEQETWADQQFDQSNKFIGTGAGMPTFDWLQSELDTYLNQ